MATITTFKKIIFHSIVAILISIALLSCASPSQKPPTTKPVAGNDSLKKDLPSKPTPAKSITPGKELVRIYNDNARFLAGLKSEEGSEFEKLEKIGDWKQYAAWSNTIWTRLQEGQLQKVKTWAQQELAFTHVISNSGSANPPSLFYPFSGADFLYANTLFPKAEQYIMIGLEPVGKVPDIRKIPTDFWENYFLALRTSMDDILTASFFKTKDMRVDFKIQELKGTLPLLMIFIVRTGHRIVTMEPVEINDSGKFVDSRFEKIANHQYNEMHGIRITYENDSLSTTNTQNLQKTVYYFPIDLSEGSLSQKPAFGHFLNNHTGFITFIKSASYLMHENNFSTIRSLIIKHSNAVIQDDSGIPLKYFTQSGEAWEPGFYGSYKAPIPMFKKYYQEDLETSFSDTLTTRPLPFRIGYGNLTKSNILVIKKNIKQRASRNNVE